MSYRAELYAIDPQDLALMVACYRPMGFASRHFDDPIDSAQAREWLAVCAPLIERLGPRASEDLQSRVKQLREGAPGWDQQAMDFTLKLQLHALFDMLAREFLARGARVHESERLTVVKEAVFEAFQVHNFDHQYLVPTWEALHPRDDAHAFASSPVTHSPFGRYFIWRSAEEVRSLFQPVGWLFKRLRAQTKTPSPEEVIEMKHTRGSWVASSGALRQAWWEILLTRQDWNCLVDMLRTCARLECAFISACQDLTDYA
jgi:hypothetical protein